jgi:hypothetical protein
MLDADQVGGLEQHRMFDDAVERARHAKLNGHNPLAGGMSGVELKPCKANIRKAQEPLYTTLSWDRTPQLIGL